MNTQILIKKVKHVFYTSAILQAMVHGWFGATYSLFLASRGLDLAQILSVNAVFMSVSFLLDPLTGPLGDHIGQRKTYLYGVSLFTITQVMYFFADSLALFYVVEGIGAIGYALQSEAMGALIQSMVQNKKAAHKIRAQGSQWGRLGSMVTTILGGYGGGTLGLEWPWIFSAGFSVISIIYLIMNRDLPDSNGQDIEGEEIAERYRGIFQAFISFLKAKETRFVGLIMMGTSLLFQPINMFWGILSADVLGSEEYVGVIGVMLLLFMMVGGEFVKRITIFNRRNIAWVITSVGLPILVAGLTNQPMFIIGGLLLHEIGRVMIPTLNFSYLEEYVDDTKRFTQHSIKSSLGTMGSAMGLVLFGFVTDYFEGFGFDKAQSIQITWIISAVGLFAIAAMTLLSEVSKRKEAYGRP